MKKRNLTKYKHRNPFIVQAFKNEIDLKTKVEEDRTKYTRKIKHKSKNHSEF